MLCFSSPGLVQFLCGVDQYALLKCAHGLDCIQAASFQYVASARSALHVAALATRLDKHMSVGLQRELAVAGHVDTFHAVVDMFAA